MRFAPKALFETIRIHFQCDCLVAAGARQCAGFNSRAIDPVEAFTRSLYATLAESPNLEGVSWLKKSPSVVYMY